MVEFLRNPYLTEQIIEETIRDGSTYYRPARLRIARTPRIATEDLVTSLTPRETEVLNLIARGLSNSQISNILTISSNTVRAHLYVIYSKLGVDSRTAAARIAFEMGL